MGVILCIVSVLMVGAALLFADRQGERKDREITRLTNLLIAKSPGEAIQLHRMTQDERPTERPASPTRVRALD